MHLSAINFKFSWKKVIAAAKIHRWCSVKKGLQLLEGGSEVFKNTYFEKYIWMSGSKNQHPSNKFTEGNFWFFYPLQPFGIINFAMAEWFYHATCFTKVSLFFSFRPRLHEIRSELKPVWNLKPLRNVVPCTWQFTWRFHCDIFRNSSKTLLCMWKWYVFIDANLINAKQMLPSSLFFKQ